ncbi:DNA-directed RNA polymerases II, IV and V subunit 9B isoform X1 [Hevea brasiliensis]|uniref:DNA-directed RNA polymerases II, IV and V subunit 9B isoform X1 n=1 Tax=Hevea brasiliensis TaxID=3981 RepID=UPI0025D5EDDD|nr:DNA-directed RNA polymerases II, IV and V subunit 9B isoform X1 [Hevea brasiliensis]
MSVYKFCPNCNNIPYPKEDKKQRILLFACRNCDHQEIADNNRVYRNEVHHSVSEYTQILEDVASDPTLPRTKSVRCCACGHGEAVFLQATFQPAFVVAILLIYNTNLFPSHWRVNIGSNRSSHSPVQSSFGSAV